MAPDIARRLLQGAGLTALCLLMACGGDGYTALPLARLPPVVMPPVTAETASSAAERVYYAQTQETLLASGLLRTDGGGADAPFDADRLATNFLKIALYDEYDPALNGLVQQESASTLGRWVQPVRVSVQFGASVSVQAQATERARIGSYLTRLSGLTGHPIGLADRRSNFVVFVGSVDERRAGEFLSGLCEQRCQRRGQGKRLCGDPVGIAGPDAPDVPARRAGAGPWSGQ